MRTKGILSVEEIRVKTKKSSMDEGTYTKTKFDDVTDNSTRLDDCTGINAELDDCTTLEVIPGRFIGFKNQVTRKKNKHKNWLNACKKRLIFLKELLLMIVMMLVLPTWDVGSDIQLATLWFCTRRSWSISMFCVLLVHTFCSAVLWYYLEPREKKKYSWVFVIFQVFPQYRAVSIIYKFIRKSSYDEVVDEDRNVYDMMIRTMEPYVESAPQLVILTTSFLSAYGGLSGNLDDTKEMEAITRYKNAGTRKGYFDVPLRFFLATLASSFFSSSWGVTMFYKNGPTKFLPSKDLIRLDFSVALLATSCFIMWRLTMLASMISSTGYLIPLVYSTSPPTLIMNGNCATIVGVETDVFITLRRNDSEYENSQWNCEHCQPDHFYARCNETGFPLLGSCKSDCDCSACAPFCSVFGWCQVSARYGRRPKTRNECKELRKNATECWNPPPPSPYSLQRKCDNMRHHVRYELSNKKNTTNVPFYVQRETKYSIVWDEQMHRVLYAPPKALERCQLERKYCENWQIQQHLYCTDPVTASLWAWIVIFLLPNFLLNILILLITFRYSFFRTVIQYPQLLFQGIFGNFLFGPADFRLYGDQNRKLQISGPLSVFNFVLSSIQFALGLFILSRNYYWRFTFDKGGLIDSLPSESKQAISAMEKELVASVAMFLISWKSALFVFLRITEKGQLVPTV